MVPEYDRLLDIEEAAARLGRPVSTLYYWRKVRHGGPPSAKIGRRIVYRERQLQEFIDAQFSGAA